MSNNFQEKVTFIWDLADLLRGAYKRNEYQKVILPFTVLKRFDSVLEYSKKDVLDNYNNYKDTIGNLEPILSRAAVDKDGNELGFYNYSKYDFKSLIHHSTVPQAPGCGGTSGRRRPSDSWPMLLLPA